MVRKVRAALGNMMITIVVRKKQVTTALGLEFEK